MTDVKKEHIYNKLVDQPIINDDLLFEFQAKKDDATSDLRELIIKDRNTEKRKMLTDYIVTDELVIRIKLEGENVTLKLDVTDLDVKLNVIGKYLHLDLDTFQNLAKLGKFSVEEY